MPEPTKRGRPPAPHPRQKLNIYLTAAEVAALDRLRGDVPQAVYARQLLLQAMADPFTKAMAYHDSGQAAIDEADAIAADLAETERQIARLTPASS